MADLNAALAGVHAFAAQAAQELASVKAEVDAKAAELAAATGKLAAAEAQHIKALAIVGAASAGSIGGAAVAKVEQGASAAWKWAIGAGLPAVGSAATALWYFWPKL